MSFGSLGYAGGLFDIGLSNLAAVQKGVGTLEANRAADQIIANRTPVAPPVQGQPAPVVDWSKNQQSAFESLSTKKDDASIRPFMGATYDLYKNDPNAFNAWAQANPTYAGAFFATMAKPSWQSRDFQKMAKEGKLTSSELAQLGYFGEDYDEYKRQAANYVGKGLNFSGKMYDDITNPYTAGDFFKIAGGGKNTAKNGLVDWAKDNPLKVAGMIGLAAVGVPAAAAWGGAAAGGTGLASMVGAGAAGGAAMGAGSSLIQGGGIKDAFGAGLMGGLTGAVTGGIGHYGKAFAQSLTGAGVPSFAANTITDTVRNTVANGGDPKAALTQSLVQNGIDWSANQINEFMASQTPTGPVDPTGDPREDLINDKYAQDPLATREVPVSLSGKGPITDPAKLDQVLGPAPEGTQWEHIGTKDGRYDTYVLRPLEVGGGGGGTLGGLGGQDSGFGATRADRPIIGYEGDIDGELKPVYGDWEDSPVDPDYQDPAPSTIDKPDYDLMGPTLGVLGGLATLGGGSKGGSGTGAGSGTGSGTGSGNGSGDGSGDGPGSGGNTGNTPIVNSMFGDWNTQDVPFMEMPEVGINDWDALMWKEAIARKIMEDNLAAMQRGQQR